jgi:polysaccharide pyruvyl transferase WcaK-like protein
MGNGETVDDYRVCLLGASLDMGNRGCCALAVSLIKLIIGSRPEAKIFLLYGNRTAGGREVSVSGRKVQVEVVNYRLSPRARLSEHLFWILLMACLVRLIPIRRVKGWIIGRTPWLRRLREANLVGNISGGDSFSGIYGLKRFVLVALPCLIAILLGKELVQFPQTYGPYNQAIARRIARYVLKRSALIYARDMKSIEVVRALLGKDSIHKDIRFCPDVAFALDPIKPEGVVIEPPLDAQQSVRVVGLNVSGLLYIGGYTRDNMFHLKSNYKECIHALVERLVESTDCHVLLVPHVFGCDEESDEKVCREIWESMAKQGSGRVHLVKGEYGPSEIKAIIGLCDFFIGSRMHSCIAALSQLVPCVGLAYSQKFQGVFGSVGVEDLVIDIRERTALEIQDGCLRRLARRDLLVSALAGKISAIKEKLQEQFDDLLIRGTGSAYTSGGDRI